MAFRIAVTGSVKLRIPLPVTTGRHRRVNVNSGLGSRKKEFRPGVDDYHAYVAQQNSWLLQTNRGHIALQYGGLISRLARLELSDDEGLRGPGEDVYDKGACLWDGHSDHAYWHENLTEHEIDLICGVYHVQTGRMQEGAEQTMLLSFWPKPNVWAKGNLTPGWWSEACEKWFLRRLERLDEGINFQGNGILCRPEEWKHNL
ncbi:hypothetical protein MSAN_02280300 [Mycena sanguinolenta]|uniref:Uncharacterized protein n=1 Tax=Mycena sanguinolenta TaxID=230812 RepID=A0A8H6X9S6_9AGAR|nr:hypothetical protein MSAN_02280300 [Mycena sanguinolenta]